MINFNYIISRNNKEHNPNWPQIPDHPYRTLIIWGSGSGKTNTSINLIRSQPYFYKIYLYAKDSNEKNIKLLINRRALLWL